MVAEDELGAHVSAAGGVEKAPARARELDALSTGADAERPGLETRALELARSIV